MTDGWLQYIISPFSDGIEQHSFVHQSQQATTVHSSQGFGTKLLCPCIQFASSSFLADVLNFFVSEEQDFSAGPHLKPS